ncbi:MAG: YqgE/AlgH family protein [Sphingobium sp.]
MSPAQADIGADNPRFYAGRMLLAMPGMADDNFRRAAIAMCVHDEHGAMGIDVGNAIEGLSLAELMASFDIEAEALAHVPVMRGGPVEPQRGFVLHGNDWGGQDRAEVSAEWSLSGSLEILEAIAAGEGPSRYIVALGYTGWGGGQLEHEMTLHGWFLGGEIPADLAGLTPGRRWNECFRRCGVDTRLLAGTAGLA